MTKRLFIFAGYDQDGIIDESLLYYLNALSKLGDIVFNMDNRAYESELVKIRAIPNVLHAAAERHNEYDFGSYKRGYVWAAEQGILQDYDWVYIVNDSVYGPLRDLRPILEDLESRGADATGMYYAHNHLNMSGLQSWFIGLRRDIAVSDYLGDFMHRVKHMESKQDIIILYEFGLSRLLADHGCRLEYLREGREKNDIFRNPMLTLKQGIPFLKKSPAVFGKINSEHHIKKYIPQDLITPMRDNMFRRGVDYFKYKKIWDIRLFGLIPLIALYREKPGGSVKMKLVLFKVIRIATIALG